MRCSDLALGVAKDKRGSAVTFHPDMETDFEREMTMTSLAREAPWQRATISNGNGIWNNFYTLVKVAWMQRRRKPTFATLWRGQKPTIRHSDYPARSCSQGVTLSKSWRGQRSLWTI